MPFKTALKSISGPRRRNTGGSTQGVSDGEEVMAVASATTPKRKRRRIRPKFRRNTSLSPNVGENPAVFLRVQVLSCRDLLAKDRNGYSDPFVTVSLLKSRHQTPVIKRTIQPVYSPKDATFDFPIYISLANNIGALELVVWDKDVLRKEYLGEVAFLLEDWFDDERPFAWEDAVNEATSVVSLPLVSTRSNTSSRGSVQIRVGFVSPPGQQAEANINFATLFRELSKRSRPSLVSVPPTIGIGTIRSHPDQPALYEDDGGISSDSDPSDEEDEEGSESDLEDEGGIGTEAAEENQHLVTLRSPHDTSNIKTPTPSSRASTEVTTPTQPRETATLPYFLPRGVGSVSPSPQVNITPASPVPILSLTTPPAADMFPTASSQPTTPVILSPVPQPPPITRSHSSSVRISGIIPRIPKFPTRRSISNVLTPPPTTLSSTPQMVDLSIDIPSANTYGNAADPLTASPQPLIPSSGAVATVGAAVVAPALRVVAAAGAPSSAAVEEENESKKKRFRKSWGSRRNSSTAVPQRSASEGEGSSSIPSAAEGTSSGGDHEKQKQPQQKKARRRVKREEKKPGYSLAGENDILGIVMLEIQSADDLPRLKNMTRTGWDMDPFVVISFGKKVFRTRVIRHSRSPVWDEKLLFHVRRYETAFKVQLTILDWDKLSSNDYIGDARFDVKELVDSAPQPHPETGLYPMDDCEHPMKQYTLPLTTEKGVPWEKHNPTIKFRAKYQPYAALRQRFWYQYLKQYDTDDTLNISHLELTSMLDSLGSTLTDSTINSFFTRFNKTPQQDDLTILEAIQCLETELGRPDAEKKRVDEGDGGSGSLSVTPVLMAADREGKELNLEDLDFSGPPLSMSMSASVVANGNEKILLPETYETEASQLPLSSVAASSSSTPSTPQTEYSTSSSDAEMPVEEYSFGSTSASNNDLLYPPGVPKTATANELITTSIVTKRPKFPRGMRRYKGGKASASAEGQNGSTSEPSIERVINVKNCPLCHRPRLSSKAEMDIVTHLAICASQDWNKVDRIVVENFVTASQAQRKWYTRILGKVSSGDYKLGANSANIIVQNRVTGQLEEEKMQVYVRLGIRLLYKGMRSRLEGGRARRLLKSLSIKQGIKYDSPESVKGIPGFIAFHGLNMEEVLEPIESFKTFNQFFYRKLKPDARPIAAPDDPFRLVSAADCRMMAFQSVNDATRLWIKGREFTVSRLLGDAYKDQAERYNGGAVAIFRLAPQDYHRFHSPVHGTIGPMSSISGEYYTVNPQAIRTALDVYGDNVRKIVPIDSPEFGCVMTVCIGAMMVGTIQITVEEGQVVQRGQELGYFAFGGSTVVLLLEPGVVEWDEDLIINGKASLETFVRVGMGIGKGLKRSQ
ncbi:hypothetical protein E1B28_010722 [Marasmius oreades]|uniref:Phosphatidylserine decarboxylase proenzyme 2 n=1 Tax=Marasmius oreades TaxID=181124 RepID=A0A9P7RSN4_9AGAR|nr:uncharacterized protein E1B28_010722 [Marasmius oreades]KAG7089009.1 hypothetical protein E1B28_010722 [Marasmius oreades]